MPHSLPTARLHVVLLSLALIGCGASGPRPDTAADLRDAGRLVGHGSVVLFEDATAERVVATVPAGLEARRVGEVVAGRVPVVVGDVIPTRGWVGTDHFVLGEPGLPPEPVADLESAERLVERYAEGDPRTRTLPAGSVLSRRGEPVATARADAYVVVRSCAAPRAEVVAVGDEGIVIAGEVDASVVCGR